MSKTPNKSLLTVILAFCLLIAQAAFLGSSSTANASKANATVNVGTKIFLSQTSNTQGNAANVTVTGTGFTANSPVFFTFNAPNPLGGLGVHPPDPMNTTTPVIVVPPGPPVVVNGDNASEPVAAAVNFPPTSTPYQNAITWRVTADASGNITNLTPGNPVIQIPNSTTAGNYLVVGFDAVTGNEGTATYSVLPPVTNPPTPQLSVTSPLGNGNVPVGGIFGVTSPINTFGGGAVVHFFLEDFAAQVSFGPYTEPAGVNHPGLTAGSIPLTIVSCSSGPFLAAGAVGNPSATSACTADTTGIVAAQLQLADASGANAIVSSRFFDQQYAVVAKDLTSGKQLSAGIKIDHSQARISLLSNRAPLGGPVQVRGYGYGGNSTIQLYFGGQAAGNGCTFFYNNGALTPPTATTPGAPAYNSAIFPTPASIVPGASCLVGFATTDVSGSFNATVNVPGSLGATTTSGAILAEDFGAATLPAGTNLSVVVPPASGPVSANANLRLNQGALQDIAISTQISGNFGVAPNPAAIGQSVIYSGTGYIPFESVVVKMTGTGCPTGGSFLAQSQADGLGNVSGTFIVPNVPACDVIANPPTQVVGNLGATVTITAAGGQSSLQNAAPLTIPATTAGIGFASTGVIALSGAGFASGEPVTFQFGLADPFTGLPTNALSLSTTADASGKVSGTTTAPSTFGSGLFTVTATGLNSQFNAQATNIVSNNGFLNGGVVPCVIGPLLAGQFFQVTGTQFAAGPGGNLFNNNVGNGTLSVNFSPTALTVPITVDATGAFTTTAAQTTVPLGTAPGTYTMIVSAFVPGVNFPVQRTCTVTVVAGSLGLLINPSSGPIGSTVAISATGFAPGEPVVASLQFPAGSALAGQDVPGTQQTFTASATGAISATFVVKSSVGLLIAGSYNLTVKGGNTGLTKSAPFVVTGGSGLSTANVFFAEGFTGTTAGGANANFTETLSILNANNFTTTYTVTYFIENPGAASTQKAVGGSIGPNSVVQRSVNTDVGLNAEVAAEVSSPAPLASTRIIARTNAAGAALDSSSSLGQQLDLTAAAPTGGFNYYLATGEIQLTNEEYLTLLNPTSTAASVTINILPQTVVSSTTVTTVAPLTASVPANSRVTVPIRKNLIGKGVVQFGVAVNSNVQIAVERPEYYGDGIGSAKYGATTKPAATSAANQFIFAADSGVFPSTGGNPAVGTGNDLSEIDIINPGTVAAGSATVTVSFFDKSGNPINSQQVQVDGGQRETVEVNDVVSTQADVFSTVVTSDKNIFVERPTYYGGDPSKGGTFAVNDPAGAPAGLESVAFPFLDTATSTGAVISQTVYLYNPGATTISVRGIYASAGQTVVKTYSVAKNSILAVNVNADAATLPKTALGGIFQVVQTGSGTSDAFVASVVSNTPDFKNVVGNQGTYPIAAATGQLFGLEVVASPA